jgi:hypothetical protein
VAARRRAGGGWVLELGGAGGAGGSGPSGEAGWRAALDASSGAACLIYSHWSNLVKPGPPPHLVSGRPPVLRAPRVGLAGAEPYRRGRGGRGCGAGARRGPRPAARGQRRRRGSGRGRAASGVAAGRAVRVGRHARGVSRAVCAARGWCRPRGGVARVGAILKRRRWASVYDTGADCFSQPCCGACCGDRASSLPPY